MAPGRQTSLTQVEWEGRAERTRRAEFLDQMDSVAPRAEAAGPGRAAEADGRQPWPAETPPGTRPARCWPDLSDVACEDACPHLRLREGALPRRREEREPHPRPARQRQPARVRQGREAGGVPGGLRGGRLTAAEGTVCREGARRGRERGPGRPGRPQGSEYDQKSTDCQGS